MSGAGVEERQRGPDGLVAEPGEPPDLSRGQLIQVPAQHLDEHEFGQAGEDRLGASPAEAGFFGYLPGEAAEPGGGQAPHMHSAREAGQERIEGPEVEPRKPQHQRGRGRVSPRTTVLGYRSGVPYSLLVIGVHPAGARHDMSIPVRKMMTSPGPSRPAPRRKPPEAAPRERTW